MALSLLVRNSRLLLRPSVRLLSTPPSSSVPPTPPSPPPPPPSSSVPALDFSPDETPFKRTGARSAEGSLSSLERKRRNLARFMGASVVFGMVGGYVYLGREWEEGEKRPVLEYTNPLSARIGRANHRLSEIFDYFNKPAWPELLPPPLPPPHQRQYTLLLSIDDLLVSSTWDRAHGWRTAKRPGVDYFLAYLSQFYEIVVFTSQHSYTAMPIIDKLDPLQFYISFKLFRESTRSVSGKVVKDISYLNRDLSKVIALDTNPEHYSAQPENSLTVPPWKGNPNDKGLIGLIPFLESVAFLKPPDVRPILTAYAGKDVAIEYAKKEAENKRFLIQDWEKKREGKGAMVGGVSSLSRMFGASTSPAQTQPNRPPPTYLEQKRQEAQQAYKEEQAYLRENEENFKRLMKEDQDRQLKEMGSGSLLGFLSGGAFGAGAPPKEKKEGEK